MAVCPLVKLWVNTQMEISQINSNLTSVSLVSQWPDCRVKDFESDSYGEKLFCGIMIHNTYSMDAMGLRI